jgi:hypothetical protein
MEYKNYLVSNGRVVKRGSGDEGSKTVRVDEIEKVDKIRISRRKLLVVGILSVVLLGSLAFLSGAESPSPIVELLSFGSFILIVATVASAFVTDRYSIKTEDTEMRIAIRGTDGHRFIGEVQNQIKAHTEAGLSYGNKSDPFVESGRQKQINVGMAILVVVGAVLGAGAVAPIYSDSVTWDSVANVVGLADDGGDSPGDMEAVYEEEAEDENTFTSEFATVEFSQGTADLDREEPAPEKYINIEFTPHSENLRRIYAEIPASQAMKTESDTENLEHGEKYEMGSGYREQEDNEWVRIPVRGELEVDMAIPISEDEEYLDETQTLRPGSVASILEASSLSDLEDNTDKFIRGAIMTKIDGEGAAEAINSGNPEDAIEYPDIVGFEEDNTIRIIGEVRTREQLVEGEDADEVVLGNYTVE